MTAITGVRDQGHQNRTQAYNAYMDDVARSGQAAGRALQTFVIDFSKGAAQGLLLYSGIVVIALCPSIPAILEAFALGMATPVLLQIATVAGAALLSGMIFHGCMYGFFNVSIFSP